MSGEDDFSVQECPPPPTPSAQSTKTPRSKAGSTSAGSESGKLKLCAFHDCDEDCKQGRRHCLKHNRHLDNMRNQILKQKGQAALKTWTERCKDIDFANSQVEYMAKRSVALPMFAHQPLIDFAQWEQEFGVLVTEKEGEITEPCEEEQWVLEQIAKFGRDRQKMHQEWRQKLAGHYRRDNFGYEGCLRLWLPSKEFEEKAKTKFAKGSSVETSKTKKAPNASDLDAFRAHASEAGLDHGHEFFRGGARPHDRKDEVEVEVASGSGAEPAEASEPQSSSTKGPGIKRKGASLTLDASEDEGEEDAKSKKSGGKKRKAANLASQRAALFDALSRQLTQKTLAMTAKIQEAKAAQQKQAAAPAPANPTDVTTRGLYNEALQKSLTLATAWNNLDDIKTQLDKYNKDLEDAGKGSEKITGDDETRQKQHPSLIWAIEQAGHTVIIERKLCLRTRLFMYNFVNELSSKQPHELSEEDMEATRLQWKRMVTAAAQLEVSLKKCTNDVTKHVAGLAAAAERDEKRRKDREAKEAESRHLEQSKARLKQATADGSALAALFKLKQEDLTPMKVLEGDTIPGGQNLSMPFVIKKCSHIQTWSGNPVVLQTMTNFGARHKKFPLFETQGKLASPFIAKAGREPSEKCFMDIAAPVKTKIIDMEPIAPGWSSTSWMFALAPKRTFVSLSPNSAAFLRVLMYGDVEIYTLSVQSFLDGLKNASVAVPNTTTELEEALQLQGS